MAWLALVLAGVFEVGWAIGLKYTDGFTRLWPTVGTVGAMAISFASAWRSREDTSGWHRVRRMGWRRRGRYCNPGDRFCSVSLPIRAAW